MDLHVKSVGYDEHQHYFHHLQLPEVDSTPAKTNGINLQLMIAPKTDVAFIKPYGEYCC